MSFKIEEWQVMQAWTNGANIESTSRVHPKWVFTENPKWNWKDNDYRIADLTADGIRLDALVNDCQDSIVVSFGNEISSIGTMRGLIRTLCESPKDIPRFKIKIKHKEKKLRPWTMEEFEKHRDEWFVSKSGSKRKVIHFNYNTLIPAWYEASVTYKEFMESFNREDGSPCGVLE